MAATMTGTEVTIGWGEDTSCATCFAPLPAGAPAWLDEDNVPACADCAGAPEPFIVRRALPATATAYERPDGWWAIREEDWGDFTGPTLDAAYAKTSAWIEEQTGQPFTLTVRLRKPGAPEDWKELERLGVLDLDDEMEMA